MIHYLTTARFQYPVNAYLASWGAPLARVLRPMTYTHALLSPRLPRGAYILTDLDRLSPRETTLVESMTRALLDAGCPVLNHPTRSLERYELLRTLFERGLNRFDVVRLTEARRPRRFPVYLRQFDDHKGAVGELIDTPEALDRVLAALDARGEDRDRYILEELCDTSDAQGIYRKFSAFAVGDAIVPRHIFYDTQWLVRVPTRVDAATIAEEIAYVTSNPHLDQLREIFAIARTEFGRIDYALLDGRVQVWEINTNPQLLSRFDGGGPERAPVHETAARNLEVAFRRLAEGAPRGPRIANPAPRAQLSRVAGTAARRALHHLLALSGQLDKELAVERKFRRRGKAREG